MESRDVAIFLGNLAKNAVLGSQEFLFIGLTAGVSLLFLPPKFARLGRRSLVVLLVLYLVMSLPVTCLMLLRGLDVGSRVERPEQARGAQAIVVLGNGSVRLEADGRGLHMLNAQSTYNTLEAARLYELLGHPAIVTSGGSAGSQTQSESRALAAALEMLGVPADRIELEERSRNTFTQAFEITTLMRDTGRTRFVLVTTPEHMRRAIAVFRRLGLDPIPSPSAISYIDGPLWQPRRAALQGSHNAIYEYWAWVFYRLRGRV